ncbi:hypothetical protein [Planktotalea sp.]|uniref:hypothetical protein n=1 Tax=Planktotalea sp. TaxID=2029877 RepID=UPI0025FA5F13|nr:hypothetical protein [Planktotalea sp.]
MFRFFAVLAAVVSLSACENIDDISGKPLPIGEFTLAYNVVVAPELVMGPVSRKAEDADWIASVTKAIDDRFSRYDGDQLYHFGISLEGYVLAQPGIPLVLSPKSALIFKLTVWDDAAGKKLNEEPEQITVLERLDGDTLIGSGLTKTAEEQMEALSVNAAKLIQRYITRQHRQEQWFKSRSTKVADTSVEKDEAIEAVSEKASELVNEAESAVAKKVEDATEVEAVN